jgi:predicted nucleic-acid-binding Zn-ribbon protein
MAECPKCRCVMTEGFAYNHGDGGRLRWIDGEANFWTSLTAGFRTKTAELDARRCSQCGYVEFFVGERSKPVKTLKSLDEENERLRRLVSTLQHRVETLEAIATDPAERTAREIEGLRALPSAESESIE